MKKLLIFDLDGTLLNTAKDLTNSVNFLLTSLNLEKRSQEEVKSFLGRGPRYLIEKSADKILTDKTYETYYQIYNDHYEKHKFDFTKPYNGITELLIKLKELGLLLAVCSNKQESATIGLMDTIFPNTFDVVIGTTPKLKAKPSSDMIDYIINKLNVDKKDVLYIGDTEIDMEAAINAHVDMVAVLYGFRKKEALESYRPSFYIEKPLDLLKII